MYIWKFSERLTKIFYFKVKQAKPDEVKRLGTGMSYGQDSR